VASAPPTAESPDRRKEAAALALLLAGTKRRYDLPALVRQHGIRPKPFRQIRPTLALKADLAAPYFDVARSWAGEVDALLAAYERGGAMAVQTQLGISTARLDALVATAKRRFPAIVDRIERWHRQQWLSRVRAATGLDVSLVTQPSDVADPASATTAWNGALLDDVHRQTGGRVAAALLGGAAAAVPVSEVRACVAEAIAKVRKRAGAIGDDQCDKLSRAMDRARREAAGVTTYRWRHTPQRHPRDWHKARDGKVFGEGDVPASDAAGVPPFCKCWEEPVFN
jgi:hypothetical protein